MTTTESRLTAVETIIPSLATKEDVAKLETRLIKWMVGTVIAGMGVASTLAVLISRVI